MKKFIYKITNAINGKMYIGQTNNITRRFTEHKNKDYGSDQNKILYKAFDKYGLENFVFEVIEETENYNEREQYWIRELNTLTPHGYNMTLGGDNPPVFHGEDHHNCSHLTEIIKVIKYLLQNSTISTKEIAKITNYNVSSINRINNGEIWFDKAEVYPLRKENTLQNKQERGLMIINDLLNTTLTQKEIAKKYGVSRTAVTAINNGANLKQPNLTYPLRVGKITSKK